MYHSFLSTDTSAARAQVIDIPSQAFLALAHSSAELCVQAKSLDQQIAKEGTESLGVLAGIPIAVKVRPAHQIADSN